MAIELHVIEQVQDLTEYLELFIPEDSSCENCDDAVGKDFGRFHSFVLCVDEDDSWLVCFDCALPVIYPGE